MTKTQDYTKMMQDMMKSFPMDVKAMQDMFKSSAAMGEKMTRVALEAAEKSTEISTKWTRETLSHLGHVATVKEEPTDYTKAMTDFASAQAETAAENIAAFAEKMSKVVLEAAEKSTEISNKWTKETLARMGDVAVVKEDPADYSKSMTDFASTSAETAAEHMAAYAEVAKRVQMDTIELMLAAGKDMGAEATAAVQKATAEMTEAAKKATGDVTAAAKKATAAK